jgi:two-component system NtrC family sensor kinase
MSGSGAKPRRFGLQGRIVTVLLVVSILPLALTGGGSWIVFGGLLRDRSLELQKSVVEAHAAAIESYLGENLRALELAARTHTFEDQSSQPGLEHLFDGLNATHANALVDLGVIGGDGRHLAYVGPYDLMDKNYSDAEWFRDVMASGSYVSDVFLGFRGVPHCVMAVRRQQAGRTWILRATINSDTFDALVRTGLLGTTGDSFLVNAGGIYQTPPREGKVLETSPISSPVRHDGVLESRVDHGGRAVIQTTTWLNDGRWMLVVQQDEAEIMAPLNRALTLGAFVILLSVVLLSATTFAATRHLTGRIERANREAEQLSRDLLRSSKLASLGELSTGLAHEINNPLAIITTELTNISDLVSLQDPRSPDRDEVLESVARCNRQVVRCSAITTKMLQFGRQSGSAIRPTDVGPRLGEIVDLMRKQAAVRNVDLRLAVEPGLPEVSIDATELQQVIVNMINNSLYAIEGKGDVEVAARRQGAEVLVTVRDTGRGIAPGDIERIFQPFFTTKPVGRGTGLGLSVCYGIVKGWGGTLEAESTVGRGTTMTIRLPAPGGDPGKAARQEVTA